MKDPGAIRVSVIIPARNEEVNIEAVVRSLASQSGVQEIIAVDDQSQDRTPQILAQLAAEFQRLHTIRLASLPPGWTGKAYAAARGAEKASGEWLLFTDADTRHKPGSLLFLSDLAETEGADLLSLSPGQRMETWWEKAVIPLVYIELARLFRFDDVNDPRSPVAAANGQYILIRRSVYEAIGGFEAVRGEILEDVALARRAKRRGARLRFLPGSQWVETRMYRSMGEMWRGWIKNLFLLYGGSACKMEYAALRLLTIQWLPGALLVVFTVLILCGHSRSGFYAAWIACLVMLLLAQRTARHRLAKLGFSRGLAPYLLLGAPFLSAILVNSLWAYQLGRRIQWKGRTYSTKGGL